MVQGVDGFCLAIQPTGEDIGTIGREYATFFGYKMCTLIYSITILHSSIKILLFFSLKRFLNFYFKSNAENYMTGYRMVFDRENLKLAWSRSDCEFPSLLIYIKDLFWYSQVHCGLPLCNVWNRLFHLELGCQQQFVCLVINIYLHDSFWRYAKVVKVDSSCWNAIQVGNETMTLLVLFLLCWCRSRSWW